MSGVGVKRVIGEFPPSPSAYTEEAVFTHPGGDAELKCIYERDGSMYAGGLRFKRVRAFRFRAEGHCTAWHIEDAYDKLVEIEHSGWVAELRAADSSEVGWVIRHFLIYVDDAGAYEVAAEDCEWLPEQAA